MNKPIKKSSFFATATGALSWKERLAGIRGKAKPKATAKLEIDDANGETLMFPEIGDVSEIAEGVAVTATDGDHVFVADTTTYTVTVLDGIITKVLAEETEIEEEASAMSPETVEFIEAVAQELGVNEEFRATAQASIDDLTSRLATALSSIETMRATMTHKTPEEGEGSGAKKPVKIGKKEINLDKINLNGK